MIVVDNETKRGFVLESVYTDKIFERIIYQFYAIGCDNWQWNIPVYNNESLEEVLKKCNLTIYKNK